MTEYNQPTERFDEIDKLNYQLEVVQKLHADSLRELQETEGKLLDKSAYRAKRQAITEAHEQASKLIQDQIEETKAETRKQLALSLRYSGETAQEKENWQEAVRLVEDAGDTLVLRRCVIVRSGGAIVNWPGHLCCAGVDGRIIRACMRCLPRLMIGCVPLSIMR